MDFVVVVKVSNLRLEEKLNEKNDWKPLCADREHLSRWNSFVFYIIFKYTLYTIVAYENG